MKGRPPGRPVSEPRHGAQSCPDISSSPGPLWRPPVSHLSHETFFPPSDQSQILNLKGKPPCLGSLPPWRQEAPSARWSGNRPPLRTGSWGVCLRVILLCSPMRARPEEGRRGLPILASGSLPCASCQEGTCRAGHPARGHQGCSTTRGIAGSLDIHTGESPQSAPQRPGPPTQTWLVCGGSLQLWLHCLTAAFSCVQLDLSFCSAWEIHQNIRGALCSLWSAGASEDGCIYWLRARQPVVKRGWR